MAKQIKGTTPPAPAAPTITLYCFGPKAIALLGKAGNTQQLGVQKLGKAWRTGSQQLPNSRAGSMAYLQGTLPASFTLAQFAAALQANKSVLSASATPASRTKAWLANGYLQPAVA